MSVVEQKPMKMSRTYITIAVVILLIAAALAYSRGWLSWSSSSYESEGNSAVTEQTMDQEKATADATPVTPPMSDPATAPTQ
jgi:hypothetical protein